MKYRVPISFGPMGEPHPGSWAETPDQLRDAVAAYGMPKPPPEGGGFAMIEFDLPDDPKPSSKEIKNAARREAEKFGFLTPAEWVSVAKRLPNPDAWCWIYQGQYGPFQAVQMAQFIGGKFQDPQGHYGHNWAPTHWMPIARPSQPIPASNEPPPKRD